MAWLDEKERESYANIPISLESKSRSKIKQKPAQLFVMLGKKWNEIFFFRDDRHKGAALKAHGVNGKHDGYSLDKNGKFLMKMNKDWMGDQ